MTIQEAQKKVDRWIREYGVRYFEELTNMTILIKVKITFIYNHELFDKGII